MFGSLPMGCRPYRRNSQLGLYGVALMLSSLIRCIIDRLDVQIVRHLAQATLEHVAAALLVEVSGDGDGPQPTIQKLTNHRARQFAALQPAGPDRRRIVLVLS